MDNSNESRSALQQFGDMFKWENASTTSKIFQCIIAIAIVIVYLDYHKYDGDVTVPVMMTDGSVVNVLLKDGCGHILNQAASGGTLTDEAIQKLISTVPKEDALLVYSAMRSDWYRAQGWTEPALFKVAEKDTEAFIRQYYGDNQ